MAWGYLARFWVYLTRSGYITLDAMTNSSPVFGLRRSMPLIAGLLLAACGSVGDRGTSRLYDAVEANDVARVRRLLEGGADPNDHIRYPMFVWPNFHRSEEHTSELQSP